MKIIVVLIISLISCKSFGQVTSVEGYAGGMYDTVKCVMLVCDTSCLQIDSVNGGEIVRYYNFTTKWVHGYEVKTIIHHPVGFVREGDRISYNEHEYKTYSHETYLDVYKRSLLKSVMVWQSVSLEPNKQ